MTVHYRLKNLVAPTLRRAMHPAHVLRALKLARGHARPHRGAADERLQLFARLLPGGYLNYGYHADPDVRAEDLSLADIARAQVSYGELILGELEGVRGLVLDVGCGMGGLLRDLVARGFQAVGVTPDRHQIAYLRREQPELDLVESKFEDLDRTQHRARFAAVVNAESVQYLRLRKALRTLERVLAPGGRWIVCDYFRNGPGEHGGGHVYADFLAALEGRFDVRYQIDITAHVLPSIAFAHMWGERFGLPLLRLVTADLARKRPATHYLMEDTLDLAQAKGREVVDIMNPDAFAANGRYLLLRLERTGEPGANRN